MAIGTVAMCVVVAVTLAHNPRSTSVSAVASATMLGLFVTLVQSLQVFDRIALDWGPFGRILDALSLIAFDINFVAYECIADSSSSSKYGAKTFVFLALLCIYASVVAALAVASSVSERIPRIELMVLTNGWGTFALIFFITLALVAAQPFPE